MNSLQESYLKSLNPSIAVKVEDLNGKKHIKDVIRTIHQALLYKYNTLLDEENGVVYIGKRL